MAIVDIFKKVGDFVMDGFRGEDDPFEEMNEDDLYYELDGSAVKEPVAITPPERHTETKILEHPRFNKGGNEIVLVVPNSFDDVSTIVQHLKDRKIVMVNLHLLDKNQCQRTIDYVCGASQALNAQPKKVADLVFVFAPHNVTVSPDEISSQQNKFDDSLWRTSLQ